MQVDLMINPQVRVIPPVILKIVTLINFCASFYITCLHALFLSYIYVYIYIYIYNMFAFLSLPCTYYKSMDDNCGECKKEEKRRRMPNHDFLLRAVHT